MTVHEPSRWQADLAIIRDAAADAGAIALGYFGRSPEVWWKQEGRSPVSAADFAANDRLQGLLLKARPNYGWLSEETDDDPLRLECETVFVVDPIDGTRAFINGEKTWCVSVAVVHQGKPVAGVLCAPALAEEFYAVTGGEACKNGSPIHVSAPAEGAVRRIAVAEEMFARLPAPDRKGLERVRHVPSLAYRLAMVADGRIDGTVVMRNSHDWDLAAADLILQQAGGRLVDLEGERPTYNRKSVQHGVLCGGAEHVLESLIGSVRAG
ncbi:3'(2'),5'-bisphosphate nucleotidase CysQ [Rhizobium sp. SSA_523]|uniref:3'(2'),5'-bisphosphate nucleotidase CysQ n=1 Tax=Rhizobium sp. SSA_523 TaxID=2952477 RepID=UPI002090042F|nr:3'(2'),5'-bisphosphate nucleotidase CysQ [Rhizobium sp. SSA_523]MCO5731142.1 3'(2'),5'-bisphosphate nucleotidase CysQ [Rhizobium sp. SSA_523]WKC24064.1 3'(2'),5'-bisphosphate nucleotidase CysQ [Rhizobium sp. SSA_523]